MRSPNIRYLPAVDHLRAFAATLIVVYHSAGLMAFKQRYGMQFDLDHWLQAATPIDAIWIEGHTAVSLFLVLSGFIFTHGAHGRRVRYAPFLRNRILRIYPLFLVTVFTGIAMFPDRFSLAGLVQSLLTFANYHGELDLGTISTLYWTVSVELQFYLLFPFLLRFLDAYGVRYAIALIALVNVLRLYGFAAGGNLHSLAYYSLLGRLDQFVIGMLAARCWLASSNARSRLELALVPALAAICGLLFAYNRAGGWPVQALWKLGWPTVEAIAWGSVVLGYLSASERIPQRIALAIGSLGTLSYSMYLLHFPIVMLSLQVLPLSIASAPESNALVNALALVVPAVVSVSLLTYYVIERPFLRLRGAYLVRES